MEDLEDSAFTGSSMGVASNILPINVRASNVYSDNVTVRNNNARKRRNNDPNFSPFTFLNYVLSILNKFY